MSREWERGYSLLLVVFVVALLSVILLVVARVQGDVSQQVRRTLVESRRALSAESIAARTTYLLLVEPIGARSVIIGGDRAGGAVSGVGGDEIRLDGRWYATSGQAFVSLQDEAGLLNVNTGDDQAMANLVAPFLRGRGQAANLAAALGDYIDADDLERAGGAESRAYAQSNQPAPVNRSITTRFAAFGALGWRQALSGQARFWNYVSAAHAPPAGININTAPVAVISAVTNSERRALAVAAQREGLEIRNIDEVQALTGVATSGAGAGFAFQPGDTFRLTVAFGESLGALGVGYQTQIVLADPGADRPFYWRQYRRVRSGEAYERDYHATEALPDVAISAASR